MMTRYAILCFEHDRGAESPPPCLELDVDVRVPWAWVEATIGEVPVLGRLADQRATRVQAEGTIERVAVLADRYRPKCPACGEPLDYVAWSIEDYEDAR